MNNQDKEHFETPLTRGVVILILLIILLNTLLIFSLISKHFFYNPFQYLPLLFFLNTLIPMLLFYFGFFESGMEVSFRDDRYRKYYSRGMIRFGKWYTIPSPEYILIRKNTNMVMNHWRTRRGLSRKISMFSPTEYFYYEVDLITKGAIDLHFFTSREQRDAERIAIHICRLRGIRLYERTINGDIEIKYPEGA